jgi:hypothetical protein
MAFFRILVAYQSHANPFPSTLRQTSHATTIEPVASKPLERRYAFDCRAGASGFRDFPRLAGDEGESQIQSPDPAWPRALPGLTHAGNFTYQKPIEEEE